MLRMGCLSRGTSILLVLLLITVPIITTEISSKSPSEEVQYTLIFKRSLGFSEDIIPIDVKISPTENRIYVTAYRLHSQITPEGIIRSGTYVYILDFQGNIIGMKRLPGYAERIVISRDGKRLFSWASLLSTCNIENIENYKAFMLNNDGDVLVTYPIGKLMRDLGFLKFFQEDTHTSLVFYNIIFKTSSDLKTILSCGLARKYKEEPPFPSLVATRGLIVLMNASGGILWHKIIDNVTDVAISPDGSLVIVGTQSSVISLDRKDGKAVWRFNITNFNKSLIKLEIKPINSENYYIIAKVKENGKVIAYVLSKDGKAISKLEFSNATDCWVSKDLRRMIIATSQGVMVLDENESVLGRIFIKNLSGMIVFTDCYEKYICLWVWKELFPSAVYFISRDGRVLWNLSGSIKAIDLSKDGSKLAYLLIDNENETVIFFDTGIKVEKTSSARFLHYALIMVVIVSVIVLIVWIKYKKNIL